MNQLRDSRRRITLEAPKDKKALSEFENTLAALELLDNYELDLQDNIHQHKTRRYANWFFFVSMLITDVIATLHWFGILEWVSKREALFAVFAAMFVFLGFWGVSERKYVQKLAGAIWSKFTQCINRFK